MGLRQGADPHVSNWVGTQQRGGSTQPEAAMDSSGLRLGSVLRQVFALRWGPSGLARSGGGSESS